MKELIIIIIFILVCLALTIGLYVLVDRPGCDGMTKDIGLHHRWTFWGGCQVQENGNWIPLKNWRYITP